MFITSGRPPCSMFSSNLSPRELNKLSESGYAIPDHSYMQTIWMAAGWTPWSERQTDPKDLLAYFMKAEEEYKKAREKGLNQ